MKGKSLSHVKHVQKALHLSKGWITILKNVHPVKDQKMALMFTQKFMIEKNQFKCQICNENFKSKQYLIIHSASMHDGKKSLKTFKCDSCDANYPQKSNLDNHFQSVHEGKRPLEYDISNASFAQKRNLKSHILSVHESKKTSSSRL